WPSRLLSLLPVTFLLSALFTVRARDALRTPEFQTASATLTSAGSASAGTTVLSASGYLVARRKAVVSAKIQGRLAALRVEEGDRVRDCELIARLESSDYEAQGKRSAAA